MTRVALAAAIAAHGVIHLIGFVVPWQLGGAAWVARSRTHMLEWHRDHAIVTRRMPGPAARCAPATTRSSRPSSPPSRSCPTRRPSRPPTSSGCPTRSAATSSAPGRSAGPARRTCASSWTRPCTASRAPPMRARSVQYNFFGRPTRLFLMEARMFGLPVRALHVYRQEPATFTVRVASTVNMVDLRGEEISAAETVTVLNDMCLMAPGAWSIRGWHGSRWTIGRRRSPSPTVRTSSPRRWCSTTATSSWTSGPTTARTAAPAPSSRCAGRHRHRVPRRRRPAPAARGGAVYHRPDGPFTYGEFTLRSIQYDVPGPVRG